MYVPRWYDQFWKCQSNLLKRKYTQSFSFCFFMFFFSKYSNLYNLPSNHFKGLTAHKLSSQGFFALKALASSLMKKVWCTKLSATCNFDNFTIERSGVHTAWYTWNQGNLGDRLVLKLELFLVSICNMYALICKVTQSQKDMKTVGFW